METKVQIPFEQILTAVKTLTPIQKARLKQELNEQKSPEDKNAFIETLLNGPVYSEKQIQIIEENRKSITKWRTKR